MKLKPVRSVVAVSLAITGIGSAGRAFADGCDFSSGGAIANAIECNKPAYAPLAKAIDVLHGQLGQPLDHLFKDLF